MGTCQPFALSVERLPPFASFRASGGIFRRQFGSTSYSLPQQTRLFRVLLRFDTRTVIFGPVWARERVSFDDIQAIQLLRVLDKDKVPYEINIVIAPHQRLPVFTAKNKTEADNTVQTLSDLIKAPVVEQIATGSD